MIKLSDICFQKRLVIFPVLETLHNDCNEIRFTIRIADFINERQTHGRTAYFVVEIYRAKELFYDKVYKMYNTFASMNVSPHSWQGLQFHEFL